MIARQATVDEKRARENKTVPASHQKRPSLSSTIPSAATPGRGLAAGAAAAITAAGATAAGVTAASAAAAAAPAEQEKYENLTEEQKQARAKQQKAALAEAASMIPEASKEEELKRLELAALEKERLQELEEEAAATAAVTLSGGDSGSSAAGGPHGFSVAADGDGGESAQDAQLRQVAEALKEVAVARGEVAGGSPGAATETKPAVGVRRPISRGGSFALDAAAAASAAVEAVTGVKGFTPGGTKEAVAREAAAAEAEDGGAARRVQTVGWGENNDQTGPGSIKDRLGVFSSDGNSGKKAPAAADGADADADADAPASGVVAGLGESIKNKLGLFASVGKQTSAGAGAAAGAGASPAVAVAAGAELGEPTEDGFPTEDTAAATGAGAAFPTEEEGSERAAAAMTTTTGWGENNQQSGPGSIKDRLGAFSGDKEADGSTGSVEAGAGAGRLPPPYRTEGRGGGVGDVHASVPDIPSVSERSGGGPAGSASASWGGESGEKRGPGSIKDRLGAFTPGGKKAEEAAAVAGAAGQPRSGGGGNSVHASVPDIPSVSERSGGGLAESASASWGGESGEKRGPGSIKDRLGAFTSGDKKAEEAAAAAGPGGLPPPPYRGGGDRKSVHDIVPDIPSVSERANGGTGTGGRAAGASVGWGGSKDQPGPGSVKDRLGAFSSSSSPSPPPPSDKKADSVPAAAGVQPPPYPGAGAGEGGVRSRAGSTGSSVGSDRSRPGSIKDRVNSLYSGGEAAAGAEEAGGKAEARLGTQPRRGDVHGAVAMVSEATASGGELGVGRVDTTGWGEGKDQVAPGSVKDRISSIYGSGKAQAAAAAAGAKADGVPGGRPPPYQTGAARAANGGLSSNFSSSSSLASGASRSPPPGAKVGCNGRVRRSGSGAGTGTSPSPPKSGAYRSPPPSGGVRRSSSRGGGEGNMGTTPSPPKGGAYRSPPPTSGSGGVRRSGSGSAGTTPSPPKRKSSMTREEAIAALADAEAAAAREEKEWALKVKALEEERRKAREQRHQLAVEAAVAAGLPPPVAGRDSSGDEGDDETGSVASSSRGAGGELVDVRARALRLDEDAKKRAEVKKREDKRAAVAAEERRRKWAQDSGGGSAREAGSGSGGREAPLARAGSTGSAGRKPRKRSMRKSGFPHGSFEQVTSRDDSEDGMEAKKVRAFGGWVREVFLVLFSLLEEKGRRGPSLSDACSRMDGLEPRCDLQPFVCTSSTWCVCVDVLAADARKVVRFACIHAVPVHVFPFVACHTRFDRLVGYPVPPAPTRRGVAPTASSTVHSRHRSDPVCYLTAGFLSSFA